MKSTFIAILLGLVTTTAYAGDVMVLSNPEGEHIAVYTGAVADGDSNKLAETFEANNDIELLYMVSPGGAAFESFKISDTLNNFHVKAYVPEGLFCLSACAEAVIGADDYEIDGVIGLHKSWVDPKIESYNDGFKAGQEWGGMLMQHRAADGFNLQLSMLINEHTNETTFLTFFNENDVNKFKTDSLLDEIEISETWKKFHVMGPEKMMKYMDVA